MKTQLQKIIKKASVLLLFLISFSISAQCPLMPGSSLIDADDEAFVSQCFANTSPFRGTLLYKMSRDGASSYTFHSLCDGQGPTLVLYKNANNGQVFGGYNPQSWNSSGNYNYGTDGFLFNLTYNYKLSKLGYNGNYQTYNYGYYGPTFGGGHDIGITSTQMDAGYNYCYPYSYENPSSKGPYSYIAGEYNFMLEDIEVYALNPSGIVASGPTAICAGDSLTLTAVGGDTYQWSTGSTNASIVVAQTGDYSVTVSSANTQCPSVNYTQHVYVNAPLNLTATQVNVSQPGACDGAVSLFPSGGTQPYNEGSGLNFTGSVINTNALSYGGPGATFIQDGELRMSGTSYNWDNYVFTNATTQRSPGKTFQGKFMAEYGTYTMIGWHDSSTDPYYTNMSHAIYVAYGSDLYVYEHGQYMGYLGNFPANTWYDFKIELQSVGAKYYIKPLGSSTWTLLLTTSTYSDTDLRMGISYYGYGNYYNNTFFHTDDWSGGAGVNPPLSGLCAGTYTYFVTDSIGCTASQEVTILDDAVPLSFTSNQTNINCFGAGNGSITVSATGGQSPYEYSFDGGTTYQAGNTFVDVPAGTYTLVVKDQSGNAAPGQIVTITQPAALNGTIQVIQNASCELRMDGALDVSVSGGTSPYTYAWSNGATSEDVNGLGQGAYSVTVYDTNHCTLTLSAQIIVVDTIAPVANCKNISVSLDDMGHASISGEQIDNYSSDACGIASAKVFPKTFTCANIGPNAVTLTVTDVNGNVSTCVATVTVVDDKAPVVNCKKISVYLDANGQVAISPGMLTGTVSDNCGIASMTTSVSNLNCSNIGVNKVTVTVTDLSGNVSSCTATVIVKDTVKPIANCKNISVQLNAYGHAVISAADVNNGSFDACGIASLSINNNTFDCSNIGANTVVLTVTDVNGNVSTCTSLVTVEDHVAPALACQDITIQLDAAGDTAIYVDQVINFATDACGIASKTVSPATFNCSNVGTNIVTVTVTDTHGNTSTCQATVTVEDNTAPVAIAQNLSVQLDPSGTVVVKADDIDNGSSDACGIASVTVSQSLFNCSDIGANTVTFTVTDVNGNVSSTTSVVTISDNTAPLANAHNITIALDASGNASITAAQIDNGSSDECGIASVTVSPTAFTCANIGDNQVTLTVTDNNGNVSTTNATVTVQDNTAPVATTQNITVQLDLSGNASVTAAQIDNGSSDACGIAAIAVSPETFTCANIGANAVSLTVTDNNGNVSTASATVIVIDNGVPVAVAQNITVQLDAVGNASITAAQIDNGSSDACGIASLAVAPNSFSCANVGANAVTLTVTDNNGNVSTANATVIVQDNTAPLATTQNITVQLDAVGNASITAAQIDNGSSDACGIAAVSVSPTTFTCASVGNNTVTLTVTDNNGNVSTAPATVIVIDNGAPVAAAQNITVQLNASGNASITAAQINNGSSDACGIASLTVAPNSFSCANIGANTVTLTATDNNGNVSTATAVVTVQDLVAPTVVTQNVTVNLSATGTASITAAQINNGSSDACGILTVSASPTAFTCANIGANTVTLTVTDNNGNVSTGTATVTVKDVIAPLAIAKNITVQLNAAGSVTITGAQVNNNSTDYCGIASMTVSPNTFSCSNVGNNTVTLTVTDFGGNVSTATAVVTVKDQVAPTVITQNITVVLNASGNASITAAQVNNGSYDACGILGMTLTPSTFSCSNVGANTVTLKVTDKNGNVSTATAIVTVKDLTAPTISCKNITVALSNGTATITAAQVGGSGCTSGPTDACGIASATVSPSSFNCSNIGPNTVTLTVTDKNGNVATCTSVVTVTGEIPACSIKSVPTSTVNTGGDPHAIYLGYGAASTKLTTTVTGGGSFTYQWTGSNLSCTSCASPTFTPTAAGNYTFTVKVSNCSGCFSTCTINICVYDIRVPGQSGKVYLCHVPNGNSANPQTLSIATSAVPAHLSGHAGDKLGACSMLSCNGVSKGAAEDEIVISEEELHALIVFPNPNSGVFTIKSNEEGVFTLMNELGQTIQTVKLNASNNFTMHVEELTNGIYFIVGMEENQLVKQKIIVNK